MERINRRKRKFEKRFKGFASKNKILTEMMQAERLYLIEKISSRVNDRLNIKALIYIFLLVSFMILRNVGKHHMKQVLIYEEIR